MRIGIDIRCLGDRQPTGVAVYTNELLRQLFDFDRQNEYKLFYNSFQAGQMEYNFTEYIGAHLGQVKIFEFAQPNKSLNCRFRCFHRPRIDRLLGGVDLFFLPHPTFYALTKEVPMVVTWHDLSYVHYPEFFSGKQRWWHKIIAARRLANRATKIIVDSQATKRDLVAVYKLPAEKIKVINLGVNRETFTPEITDKELWRVRTKYQLPQKYILALAALEPRKNMLGVLAAFERLPLAAGYHLIIAGPKAWLFKPLMERIKNSPAKNRIRLLDYLPLADKPAVYRLAEVFLYPSFYEGFGLPPLEAMACGTPVITAFNSSLGEVVGNAGLLVDPYNLNELSSALGRLLADQKLRTELSRAAVNRAKQFDWRRTAQETLKVFSSIMKK